MLFLRIIVGKAKRDCLHNEVIGNGLGVKEKLRSVKSSGQDVYIECQALARQNESCPKTGMSHRGKIASLKAILSSFELSKQ